MNATRLSAVMAAVVMGGLLAAPATAEIQQLAIKFIGQSSVESNSKLLETPFFKEMEAKSGGKIKVDLQPFNILGLKGTEILRLMKTGTMEWASNGITFLAGERPEFEGCDLAGITESLDQAYKACAAYKPVFSRIMEKDWNVKLLALYSNPPQMFWCRVPIKGLADLKGKKVRVFNNTLTDFVEGVGGTSVTIPFADVVPAMQRGVADCAVTGSFNGNIAKWYEVTTHLYPLSLGWATQYAAVNLDTWKRLNADTQKFLTEQFLELEKRSWTNVTKQTTEQGVNCNVGKDPCTLEGGSKASMTLVKPTAEDEQTRLKVMREAVLARWGKRCGAECAKEWNATIGKVVNLQVPATK